MVIVNKQIAWNKVLKCYNLFIFHLPCRFHHESQGKRSATKRPFPQGMAKLCQDVV